MNREPERPRSLREIELEVEAEGREWTRRRLQQRLQEEADRLGEEPQSRNGTPVGHRLLLDDVYQAAGAAGDRRPGSDGALENRSGHLIYLRDRIWYKLIPQ